MLPREELRQKLLRKFQKRRPCKLKPAVLLLRTARGLSARNPKIAGLGLKLLNCLLNLCGGRLLGRKRTERHTNSASVSLTAAILSVYPEVLATLSMAGR